MSFSIEEPRSRSNTAGPTLNISVAQENRQFEFFQQNNQLSNPESPPPSYEQLYGFSTN